MSVSKGLWATIQREGNPTHKSARLWRYGLFFEGASDLWMSMFRPDSKAYPAPDFIDITRRLFDTYNLHEDAMAAAAELKLPQLERIEVIDIHFWMTVGSYSGVEGVKASILRMEQQKSSVRPT